MTDNTLLSNTLITAIINAGVIIWVNTKFAKQEKIKTDNAQRLVIHKLQFETEFNVYKILWAQLITTYDALFNLIHLSPNERNEMDNIQIIERIKKETDKLLIIIFDNRPFYHSDIYRELSELTTP